MGTKGAGVSFNTKRKARAHVSAPGTGLSYSWNLAPSKKRRGTRKAQGGGAVWFWAVVWTAIAVFTPVTAGWAIAGFVVCLVLSAGQGK